MKFKKAHLEFLDSMQVSNTAERRSALIKEFGMGHGEAKAVLAHWMETFSERQEATDESEPAVESDDQRNDDDSGIVGEEERPDDETDSGENLEGLDDSASRNDSDDDAERSG